MKRYIVKNKDGWSVVNANYKRSIKNFETQAAAINFAAQLKGTTTMYIQNKQGKFRSISGWDQTNTEQDITTLMEKNSKSALPYYIPKYVLEETTSELKSQVKKDRMLLNMGIVLFIFLIVAIVFAILYGLEVRRFNYV